ncbi:hypothetical protein KIN20_017071 [Parelaphostrongylus tenuis]|uniref:Uncharacterized protein n=1 Tax=Parelaphostrongylus tenuis TaxID=148309 RepID=A0AAD5QR78_PARTN|nr:hypothetical protein KIN20_017071 [Parelaphostrongylus tenuis]
MAVLEANRQNSKDALVELCCTPPDFTDTTADILIVKTTFLLNSTRFWRNNDVETSAASDASQQLNSGPHDSALNLERDRAKVK